VPACQPRRTVERRRARLALALLALAPGARADEVPRSEAKSSATTTTASAAPMLLAAGVISSTRIDDRPLLRPGDVHEYVPGMVVTRHSGAGKANQYFLRGFNLDHGTDFSTWVAGMPSICARTLMDRVTRTSIS